MRTNVLNKIEHFIFPSKVFIFSFFLFTFAFCFPSASSASVTRTVAGTDCEPVVTVTVTPESGTSSYAYEEYISGLTPSEISEDGVWLPELGLIRWGAFLDSNERDLSYTLTGNDGTYSISGKESQDGIDTDTDTTTVSIDCIPELEQVEAPVFDPPDGTDIPVTVTITTATEGATIYYTTDGSIPTESSSVYTAPIDISERLILQALAVKSGMEDSNIAMAAYNKPYVSPAQTLERSVTWSDCLPIISISVTPTEGTYAYAIEEEIPFSLVPQNISDDGVWVEEASVIRWGVFLDGDSRTLTYELTGPDDDYALSGTGSFDGRDQNIGGTGEITIDCIPEQAAVPVIEPETGALVPVTFSMSTATAGAVIRYTLNGSEPDESSALYTVPVLLYTAATVKAKAFKTGLAASDTASVDYVAAKRPKAIIVSGSGPFEGNNLWPATVRISNYAYYALLYQGYEKDDIQFLSHDLTIDADGNGKLDDIDGETTRENLEDTITDWATDASELLLYLTGQGGNKTFMLGETDILDASEIAEWLDTLQDTMPGRVIVIYDACQSGTFISELVPPAGKERIVITSASNEPALFLEGGILSFSYQFWASIFLTGSLYDAYLNGRDIMMYDQNSRLDSNGNGIANEKQDKIIAAEIIIGRGMVAAAAPPKIQAFPEDHVLDGTTSVLIWADDINSLDPISRVWAIITPPDYHQGNVDIPITDLTIVEMTDPDHDGRYEATYNGFTLHGVYRVMICAMDKQGIMSQPRRFNVLQQGGEIPPNNNPVAEDMAFITDEDVPIQGTLSASDSDSDTLTYIIVTDGVKGAVSITDVNTGAFIYQPHTNENGADSFPFKVNDGMIDSEIATVSITINPVEDVPVALDMNITVDQNSSVSDNLMAEDGDDDPVIFTIEDLPAHGDVIINDEETGSFTYTPATNYYGSDFFTFTADDNKSVSLPATVWITINRGYNNPPSATGIEVSTLEDTPVSDTLQGNDPDDDPLTFILFTAPAKGVVKLTDDGTGAFTYTPYDNLNGADSFLYKVSDGYEYSDPGICTINITPVNDSPVAKGGYLTVNSLSGISGSLVATDADGDPLVFSIPTDGHMGHAAITNASTGAFTYTPYSTDNGVDKFFFTVSDGTLESSPAQMTVNILIPQADISRAIGGDNCVINVTLTVIPVETVKAYAVEERLPEGLTPDNISDDGVWDPINTTIRWGVFLDNTTRILIYNLTGDDGDYDISGTGSFDGWDQDVTSDIHVNITCGSQRVATPVFDPPSGTKIPVDVTITSDTVGAEIHYTTDGSQPTELSDIYSMPLHFDNPVILKARAYMEGLYPSNTAEAAYISNVCHKAIIVTGGGPYEGNNLWDATMFVGEYAYKALLYQGYSKENIMFLSAGPNMDVDGNGSLDDIDGFADSATLEDAITNWSLDATSLIVYLTDHGGEDTFLLSVGNILNASDLDSWLDTLQEGMDGPVIVINDFCRSGTFIEYNSPPSGKTRIMISSTSDERAWFLWGGRMSFSYQFWASIFGRANLYDAYLNGKGLMIAYQTALLDGNGNGIPDEDDDLLAASNIVLGRGSVATGVAPEIGYVSPDQVIYTTTSANIAAWGITSLNNIERVWAIIIPPGSTTGSLDDPVMDMIEIDLTDPDKDGIFSGTYTDFTSAGIYRIVVYAKDTEGLFSEPVETTVNRIVVDGDIDYDGMPDDWENTYFNNTSRDGTGDYDNDGITDREEYELGTNPADIDTDDDGMPDGWEVSYGLDPLNDDSSEDSDSDGYTNLEEYNAGTDPSNLGDIYEDDDTLDTASVIVLNNSDPQQHNFNVAGDQDWVKFYGVEGELYTIETTNLAENCDTVIMLYDENGDAILNEPLDDYGYGEDELLSWQCPGDGIYYVVVEQYDPMDYGLDTEYVLNIYHPFQGVPGWLVGVVVNSLGKNVISDVVVKSSVGNGTAITNNTGFYKMSLPSGTHTITSSASGYEQASKSGVVVVAGSITTQDFEMTPTDLCPDDPGKVEPGICGCGVPDIDSDHDGTLDCIDTDDDNDGVLDDQDAFPDDPNEWLDTDEDGTGNNADLDDDDDGMPDEWEEQYGLDPLVNDASADPDRDGYTNLQEYREGGDPNNSATPFPWELFMPAITGNK
jgi:hypothetical protein